MPERVIPVSGSAMQQDMLNGSVGSDLRVLRKSRSMTLAAAAQSVGRSVGWLSQIERGQAEPSVRDLRRLADLYGVSLSLLFRNEAGPPHERPYILRRAVRRPLGNPEDGLIEELLSPDLSGTFEVIRSEFAPGASLPEPMVRQTEEAGYVVSGRLDLRIGDQWHHLEPGDSFRFRAEPFQWRNSGSEPAVVIWVIAPPTY